MKKGWEYKKLGDVCQIYNGNSINAEYKKQHFYGATGGLPFIATKDVSTLGSIDYNNGVRIPNYDEYKVAPAHSVFICAEGGSAGKKFAYVEQDVCFGNKLFCLNPKNNSLIGRFVYYFIQSESFKEQFYALLAGLIGGVSAKKFQTIEIPIPSLSVQQEIVYYLDSAIAKIDAMKANAEKALNEAKALFQASLKGMLEPKEEWEEKKFGDVCWYNKKNGLHKGTRYVGMEHIEQGTGRLLCTISSDDVLSNTFAFNKGDVLYGRLRPYLKKVIVAGFEGCCSTEIFPIQSKEIISSFLMYWFLTDEITNKVNATCAGCRMPRGNMNDVLKFDISYPSISEQQSIVDTLDSLKSKVDRLQENYDKISQECDALKQALLRQVFE